MPRKVINIATQVTPDQADQIWQLRTDYAATRCIGKGTTRDFMHLAVDMMLLPEMLKLAQFARRNGWDFKECFKDLVNRYVT